jgi:hypothetical protein
MPSVVAAQNIGVGPCRGEKFGDLLEAMALIAPWLPNEAMARIAPRSPMVSMATSNNFTRPKLGSLD